MKYEAILYTSNGGVYNINACIEYIYRSEPYAIDMRAGLCINGIKLYVSDSSTINIRLYIIGIKLFCIGQKTNIKYKYQGNLFF